MQELLSRSPQPTLQLGFASGVSVLKSLLADFNFANIFQRGALRKTPYLLTILTFAVRFAILLCPRPEPEELM